MSIHQLYTKAGKEAFISELKKCLGDNQVIHPSSNGDTSSYDYKIYLDSFKNYFKCDESSISKYSWSDTRLVLSNEIINYITKSNDSNKTMGLYHIYMDLVHTLFQIKENKSESEEIYYLPIYSDYDEEIQKVVRPKRDEFKYLWWIRKNIKSHSILSKYENDLRITYQEAIIPTDNKHYDMLFSKVDIVIELQENKENHKNNPNDIVKEAMVRMRGKRIIYFHMKAYKEKRSRYLKDFLEKHLVPILIQGLVYNYRNNENDIITRLVEYEINNYNKIKLTYLEDEIKFYQKEKIDKNNNKKLVKRKDLNNKEENEFDTITKEIEYIKSLSGDNKNKIDTIFKWYQQSYRKTNEYLINPYLNEFRQIFKLCNFNKETVLDEFLSLSLKNKYCGIEKTNCLTSKRNIDFNKNKLNLRFSWEGILNIFLTPNADDNQKIINVLFPRADYSFESKYMLNLLITIRNTYEEKIINYMFTHSEEKIISCNEFQKMIEDHTVIKLTKEYEGKIETLSKNLEVSEEKVELLNKISKKIIRSFELNSEYVEESFSNYKKFIKKKYNEDIKTPLKVKNYMDKMKTNYNELKQELGIKK